MDREARSSGCGLGGIGDEFGIQWELVAREQPTCSQIPPVLGLLEHGGKRERWPPLGLQGDVHRSVRIRAGDVDFCLGVFLRNGPCQATARRRYGGGSEVEAVASE